MYVDDPQQFIALFGLNDENVDLIRRELNVVIFAHGNEITLTGDEDKVRLARLTLERLLEIVARGDAIDKTRIRYAIDLAGEGNADRIGEIMRDVVAITYKGRQVKCKTLGQKKYVDAIKKNTLTFGIGPAGTGKTYLAMAMAVAALKRKEVGRIVLTRPVVEAGESLGFLPGTLQEKLDPYVRPLYDALFDMTDMERGNALIEQGVIEIAPLAFMRGRTLNDAFVILDEAQNTTPEQMKMFLTRLGFGSKFVVTGDASQRDLRGSSGLDSARRVLACVGDISFVELDRNDIVRHTLVARIVDAYDRSGEA